MVTKLSVARFQGPCKHELIWICKHKLDLERQSEHAAQKALLSDSLGEINIPNSPHCLNHCQIKWYYERSHFHFCSQYTHHFSLFFIPRYPSKRVTSFGHAALNHPLLPLVSYKIPQCLLRSFFLRTLYHLGTSEIKHHLCSKLWD